jgi:hypothetical protein
MRVAEEQRDANVLLLRQLLDQVMRGHCSFTHALFKPTLSHSHADI